MALSLGKLTILVGAGIVGSVIAKEGSLPDFSNLVSGAFKVVLRQLKSNDPAPTAKKPHNDALMAQVNSLRQELQLLARERSITIVNANGTGGKKYVTVIVIVVVGYGYIWWKGWKLPDMMFATRRGLSDACSSIGNQLGKLYESIEDAKKKLSARMNRLDKSLDECAALTESTREDISVIQKETDTISGDFKSVRVAVHVLESKIKEIEGKQVATTEGVNKLCQFTLSLENSRNTEYIQASSSTSSKAALELPPVSPSSRATQSGSRLSLEPPPVTPPSRTGSLPPTMSTDPPSPSNSVGLYQERSFSVSNVDSKKIPPTDDKANGSSSGLFGLKLSGYASFLTRTRSATDAVVVGGGARGTCSRKWLTTVVDCLWYGKIMAVHLEQQQPLQPTADDNNPQNGDVHCPVCGCTLPANNRHINSHIDLCLTQPRVSGTKRKLTQRTLLQLNFTRPENLSNGDAASASHVRSSKGAQDDDTCEEELKLTENHKVELDSAVSTTTTNSSLPFNNGVTDVDNDYNPNIFEVKLETFIVGRRYSDREEICSGTTVSLLRDPQNVKDPNAIKVVSADSVCSKSLGFLPRELAQYLSPLMDKYGLMFQGHVTSLPKQSLDAVPIQIMCHKTSYGENEYEDETFKCLWKNAHRVVEFANGTPSSVKYQLNFCLMLQEVLRNNNHLLTENEKAYMESFTLLSNDSQRLFIRLYTRKGPWFRMSSISYPEIMDTQKAVKELAEKEYICSVEDGNQLCESDMNDILNVLTVSELREVWCFLLKKSCGRGMKKQDLISSLLSTYAGILWPRLSTVILDRTGSCIRISSKAESLIWRTERLFFLNGEQDLSSFLLVDMGKIKYPTYNCIISEPIFSNRRNLLSYEEAIEVAQIMDEALDANKTDLVLRCIKIAESCVSTALPTSESVSTIRHLFTASWVYSKVVTLGISFLEQERRYSEAIDLLKLLQNVFTCDVRRGYWTLRLSVDLEHLGCIDESLQVAENGLLDQWVRAGSRMALQRRVLRLGKPPRRWKVPSFSQSALRKIPEVYVQGRPLNSELGAKNRFYNEEGEQCGVEELALHYYAGEGGGWQGVHTESGIWLTIFGLLMWDVIYADVPNVFYTRFQNAPLDLGTDSFYTARKSSIESHLQQIRDGMAEEFLIKSWETHIGTSCRGVNWDRHSLDELRAAVSCVGGSCLASLCQLLCQDYRSWSSGMPDLLLWRFRGEYSGEAKLVEVKGPRDRLSEQQRAWLLLLMDCGFMIEKNIEDYCSNKISIMKRVHFAKFHCQFTSIALGKKRYSSRPKVNYSRPKVRRSARGIFHPSCYGWTQQILMHFFMVQAFHFALFVPRLHNHNEFSCSKYVKRDSEMGCLV
ncbi:VRR-NUC domain [Sesbania bispinosa]|nr:VRR-NUC domain [Sesbania bispinosa]